MDFLIKEEQVFSGALSCRGCGWSLLIRHLADLLGPETVYVVPASCFSIISGSYPFNEIKANIVHTLFAAASATATGIRAALDSEGKHHVHVVILAGDGGTFDIGLQALSGAASRGENILYFVNNNGAYMNTGVQTSTATPYGVATTTSPGVNYKHTFPKDLMGIIAAHNLPYAATASLAYLEDFRTKVKKARDLQGFRLIMIDGPCPAGHKYEPSQSIQVARLAVETRLFPLFEVERQAYNITYRPKQAVPVKDCLKLQGRFKILFRDGNEQMLKDVQDYVNEQWMRLLKLEKMANMELIG
jgi:pyruvate ferredoxin oxidoreductase beta subunit/2-oxoisovalerate ferredoxin oxidoreductase beta subunit